VPRKLAIGHKTVSTTIVGTLTFSHRPTVKDETTQKTKKANTGPPKIKKNKQTNSMV
jgi:hypothetical protein